MNIRLFDCNPELKFLEDRYQKLFIAIGSLSLNLTSFEMEIKEGFKSIYDLEIFRNMTNYEFKALLKLVVNLKALNLGLVMSNKNSEEVYKELAKTLIIHSVFLPFIKKNIQEIIINNIYDGILDTNPMFLEIFSAYKLSKDFAAVNKQFEDYLYYNFNHSNFAKYHKHDQDIFGNKIFFNVLYRIQNGQNIRKVNPTSFTISKKESYFFHHQNNLYRLDDSKKYIKQRIIASKLALKNNATINHIQEYLDRSNVFRSDIDTYYNDINFWKRGFEILSMSNYREDDIAVYVDYLNFMKYQTHNFSLRKKTYERILKDIREWHFDMNNTELKVFKEWGSKEDSITKFINYSENNFEYQQIVDSKTLYLEGKKNKHCVYSYLKDCIEKQIQIWRLYRKNTNKGVTIEVRNQTIVQVRGKFNMRDYYIEDYILPIFAKEENLKISL